MKVITGLLSAVAALLGVLVALRQVRGSGGKETGAVARLAARVARWAVRPIPLLVGMSMFAVVSLLFLAQLRESDAEPSPTAVRLLQHLVSGEATACESTDPAPRAIAALSCTLPRPMASLRVSLFTSDESLRETFRERIAGAGVSKGNCGTQRFAWEEWSQGALICDYGDSRVAARLQWSRVDSQVLLEADARPGADEDAVYRWWADERNGAPSNNRLPYPDRLERYILDRTGLGVYTCKRGFHTYRDSSASVRCDIGPADFLYIYYFSDAKLLRNALHDPPGSGSCSDAGYEPGRKVFREGDKRLGVRQCWVERSDEDWAVVEWVNSWSFLYAFARKRYAGPDSLHRLFAWWQRDGRKLTD